MVRPSIWTIEGRRSRIGLEVSQERLDCLQEKKIGQLKRLIGRYKGKINPKKIRRYEARIIC